MKIYLSHKKIPLVQNMFSEFLLKKYLQNSLSSEFGFTVTVTLPHDFSLQVVSTAFKNIMTCIEDTASYSFTAIFLTSKHHYLKYPRLRQDKADTAM